MKTDSLQLKRALRTALLVLLLSAAWMGKGYAQIVCTIGDIRYAFASPSSSAPYKYPYNAAIVLGHKDGTEATGSLNIPASVHWCGHEDSFMVPVACIARNAFAGCIGLTSLSIPNSVEEICYGAFKGCSGFTGNLVIPNSVISIGPKFYEVSSGGGLPDDGGAFEGCGFKGNLSIPNSVTLLDVNTFKGCRFHGVNINTTDIPEGLFERCEITGNLTIGNSVVTIGDRAFYKCSGLTSLTIGNSVTSIGNLAFSGGGHINTDGTFVDYNDEDMGFTGELIIPNSVTTIGVGAFYRCSGFTGGLTIGNSVTTIGDYAFSAGLDNDLNGLYTNCGDDMGFTGGLIIPNSVTTIGINAFYRCSSFTGDLTIGNSVAEIKASAFRNCSGFKGELVIPKTVSVIGANAFFNCKGFSKVSYNAANCLPFFYTSDFGAYGEYGEYWRRKYEEGGRFIIYHMEDDTIGYDCNTNTGSSFYNCGGVLEIGDEVQTIPLFMFMNGAFSEVRIPSSVSSIGDWAFYRCNNITKLFFDAANCVYDRRVYGIQNYDGNGNVTDISPFPFFECKGALEIGNNVERINDLMFCCNDFTGSLVIPNSVSEIGMAAFQLSDFDGKLTLPNSLTSIGGGAFSYCGGFTGNLTIPNSVAAIGGSAFSNCSGFVGDLTIPESVTSIGTSAFRDCTGFSKVHFNPSHCSNNDATISWNEQPPFEGCGGSLEISENMEDIPAYLFKGAHFKEITMYYSEPSILHNTIGTEAFAYCDSLQSIVCWNEDPPVLGERVFAGVNKDNVIVHVPCGKAPTYKLADGWEEFPNYEMHLTAWLLTVTSNEPEHCETQIKQLPLCESGEAIVRAKPAPGYRFLGWYENDERVSQDTLYAFYLGTSRELEARVRSYTGLEDMVIVEANVYPNPISGQVKVEAENLKHITISNMFDQIIYDGNASGNEFAYDFSGYVAGVYLIRIETTSGVATKRVVVTR